MTDLIALSSFVIFWGASWSVVWAMLSTFTSKTGSISEGCAIMSIAFLDILHLHTNLGPGLPYLWKYCHKFNCFVLGVLLKIFIIVFEIWLNLFQEILKSNLLLVKKKWFIVSSVYRLLGEKHEKSCNVPLLCYPKKKRRWRRKQGRQLNLILEIKLPDVVLYFSQHISLVLVT